MRWVWVVALIACFWSSASSAQSQLEQLWNRAKVNAQSGNNAAFGLTDSKISSGLKEALTVSTGKAVAATGRPDGFFKNEAIKIFIPENLRKVGNGMRLVGMGAQVDEFELGMNRAAEQAAPAAKQIFVDALVKMTFADAHQILSGNDTAATEYFRRQSSEQLAIAFTPIVHQAMENVGVVRQYDRLTHNAAYPFFNHSKFDLDQYVVGKTLDGLFYMLGQEERRIRTNPAAQTTALLKQVFGGVARKDESQEQSSGR
jgi:Protein of unknown function (DUF4197)